MGQINYGSIGSDRGVQNPQQAVESATGVYKDAVNGKPFTERFPNLPKAPDPSPYKITGGGDGQR
jgi:hypothetical protein